jgi:hypothetical protein
MSIPNPFSPKKAQTTVFEEVIKIFWAGVVILVIFIVAIALINLIVSPADTGSKANYLRIYDSAVALYDERTEDNYCVLAGSYLQEGWAVVGFNADGVLSAVSDTLRCERGEECIREECGNPQSIEKPDKCGTGPCLCLCQGGRFVGDVDGDDCDETNAKCMPLPNEMVDAGLDRFYFVNIPREKYFLEYKSPTGESRGGLSDLVVDSENCLSGRDKGTVTALVIMKAKGIMPGTGDAGSLVFDLVESEEDFKRYYGGDLTTAIRCTDIIEELKDWRPLPPPVEKPVEERDVLEGYHAEVKETTTPQTSGTGVSVS